jgi:hypothetical protein
MVIQHYSRFLPAFLFFKIIIKKKKKKKKKKLKIKWVISG